jgi:hypothetical protein
MKMPIISLTTDVLESLDQIFYSGSKGTHLLFSTRTIRDAFVRNAELDRQELDAVAERLQPVLADLLQFDDLDDRRLFIEELEPHLRDVLVHLYFGFLERYLNEDDLPETLH